MAKKRVYKQEVSPEKFSSEETLEQMIKDREKLIRHWGSDEYERRRRALEEHIRNKSRRKIASKEPSP